MALQIYRFYRQMAVLGIVLLLLIGTISVVSICGRALIGIGLKPIPGDFELVEIGAAIAIFCFLPWTHLKRSHAVVDLFWGRLPHSLKRFLMILSDLLMLLVWSLLIWRMGVATAEYFDNGETSFILLIPVWYGYSSAMVVGSIGLFAYFWKLIETLGFVSGPVEYLQEHAEGHGHG
jgi:TRAP-type C4-dicarboxylate transport system permease small subunit